MLRRLPRAVSTVSQGYRAGPATFAVHGVPYGGAPTAASSTTLIPDMGGSSRRSSLAQLTPRRAIFTGYTRQMMSYSNSNLDGMNLVNPIDYYMKKRIIHRIHNKLITQAKGEKVVIVHDDTAHSFMSLTGLVVDNHLNNISVAQALCPDNVVMDWEKGEYAFLKLDHTNTCPLDFDNEQEDFRCLHKLILHFLIKTHGRDAWTLLPDVFQDFMNKLLADELKVQHIICHSLFLPCLSRVLLRVLLDIKLRRPLRTKYCPFKEMVKAMFQSMPYVDDQEKLDSIIFGNIFLTSLHKRNAKDQAKWAETQAAMRRPRTEEEAELDLMIKFASRLIGIMRDGVLHFSKADLPEGSEDLLNGIDAKRVIHMLNVEFPNFEQKVLELLAKHNLWDYVEVAKLFGKYAARLKEVIERDKSREADKLARDKKMAAEKAAKRQEKAH